MWPDRVFEKLSWLCVTSLLPCSAKGCTSWTGESHLIDVIVESRRRRAVRTGRLVASGAFQNVQAIVWRGGLYYVRSSLVVKNNIQQVWYEDESSRPTVRDSCEKSWRALRYPNT